MANSVAVKGKPKESSGSDPESIDLIASHALSAGIISSQDEWIMDSGASSQMCSDQTLFTDFSRPNHPVQVSLGGCHN